MTPVGRRELIGTLWRRHAGGTGHFHCPRCGEERACARNTLQGYFALLGHPVLRLGHPRVFVTCGECGHSFSSAVADAGRPDAAADAAAAGAGAVATLAEDERALVAIIAAVILSDSVVRESEKKAAHAAMRRFTGTAITVEEVDELLARARAERGDLMARLERVSGLVPPRVRRGIVESVYHVCTADGDLHPQESRLLDRIGEALDLGPQEVRKAIVDARTARRIGLLP